ncbi:MAG: hypothetical protein JXM68_06625, partial [Sedimentisphaerales bacterium]|nr:hypothetical protein [Sedimentisphaerales bacterium]
MQKGRIVFHFCCQVMFVLVILLVLLADICRGGVVQEFISPPEAARPGVYWYFMDGNLSAEAMTADLESMKAAGLGNLVFLEVNVGVPRG